MNSSSHNASKLYHIWASWINYDNISAKIWKPSLGIKTSTHHQMWQRKIKWETSLFLRCCASLSQFLYWAFGSHFPIQQIWFVGFQAHVLTGTWIWNWTQNQKLCNQFGYQPIVFFAIKFWKKNLMGNGIIGFQ
jgi:hypothetical protein